MKKVSNEMTIKRLMQNSISIQECLSPKPFIIGIKPLLCEHRNLMKDLLTSTRNRNEAFIDTINSLKTQIALLISDVENKLQVARTELKTIENKKTIRESYVSQDMVNSR